MSDHDRDRPSSEIFKVGYRRPPVETRFRPGISGNPRGRPKGARSLAAVVAATLGERITVNENGVRRRITKLEAAVKHLVNRAASGETRSMQLLIALVQASEPRPPQQESEAPTAADEMVLRDLQRRLQKEAAHDRT